MDDSKKSKDELISELRGLRDRLEDSERSLSELKQTEEVLRESEMSYRTLIEESLTGVCTVQDNKIQFANKRLSGISGYSQEELRGMPVMELIHPEDRELVLEAIAEEGGSQYPEGRFQFRGVTKNGEILWMETFGPGTGFQGRPGLFVNIIDITERKLAEDRLRETNHKLLELETLKEDLINMVVHDMKNPVSNTMMGLDMIEFEHEDRLTKQQRQYLQMAKRNQFKLSEMMTNLLEISKIESGKILINRTRFDLLALIHRSIESYAATLKVEQKTVHVSPESAIRNIVSDERLIERILSNILSNAIKHSYPKGKIHIRAIPDEEGNGVSISVRDFGEGIPEEFHQQIFEKFCHAGLRELGHRTDTGLGLTFCKMAVEELGGQIQVESEQNKGSCFTFSLPDTLKS